MVGFKDALKLFRNTREYPGEMLECDYSRYPYISRVPKGPSANVKYRKEVIKWGSQNKENAQVLWEMCRKDALFFINVFCCTFDPRIKYCPKVPFISWPYQDAYIDVSLQLLGISDKQVAKSRDMGMTWLELFVVFYKWMFFPDQSYIIASKNEDMVDKTDDPDCLFWKIKFFIDMLPGWMQPNYNTTHMNIANYDNGSVIDGRSTTDDLTRGGRRTAVILDEFASLPNQTLIDAASRDVTSSRNFVSTPKGEGNAFAQFRKKDSVKYYEVHWLYHPFKSKGAYIFDGEKLILIDKEYVHDPNYKFIPDSKIRSPWYDIQCARSSHHMIIAQELDIDFRSSESPVFDIMIIEKYRNNYVRMPQKMELEFDAMTGEPDGFIKRDVTRYSLWTILNSFGIPSKDHEYVIGVDVAQGTGASSSCVAVVDKQENELVCMFADNRTPPEDLAKIVYALGTLFTPNDRQALVKWENTGPGINFGRALINLGYTNLYFERHEKKLTRNVTQNPGWSPTTWKKRSLIDDLRRRMDKDLIIIRDEITLDECTGYVFRGETVEHTSEASEIDDSAKRSGHGDRVIAVALAASELDDTPIEEKIPEEIPIFSLAWRRQQHETEKRKESMLKGL